MVEAIFHGIGIAIISSSLNLYKKAIREYQYVVSQSLTWIIVVENRENES